MGVVRGAVFAPRIVSAGTFKNMFKPYRAGHYQFVQLCKGFIRLREVTFLSVPLYMMTTSV